ncbi:MAG: bifunctional demethylmenaquinone methyltransferase/2-methoxy-6-polyprenyl-1,4-benzoquinol methylase UbiE [Nitrospinota bacterium]
MEIKSSKIRNMFSEIAPRYDLLNSLLSLGVDRFWRARAVKELLSKKGTLFLDVAAGTGDISLSIASGDVSHVLGVDFSFEMLKQGFVKKNKGEMGSAVKLLNGDALSLPFKDSIFDGAISAFGVRNFTDVPRGISEMRRVMKGGGKLVILEFSEPGLPLFKHVFELYFKYMLPFIGGVISGSHEAYRYLHDSVSQFNRVCGLTDVLQNEGFINVKAAPLSFGIASIYTCENPG